MDFLPRRSPRRSAQAGVNLIESLVALLILSVGMLGLVGLQVSMLRSTTDAQSRAVAAALADRLLSHALLDPSHASCYAVPVVGPCVSTPAGSIANGWLNEVKQLPNGSATAELTNVVPGGGIPTGTNGQMRVAVTWSARADGETHSVEAFTDVR